MSASPFLLATVLAALVALLDFLRRWTPASPMFRFLPMPFWCYFLPMLAGSMGWLPLSSPLYGWTAKSLLPVCLALLLVNVNLPALLRLGRPAATAMALGAGGVILGAGVAYGFLHRWLPSGSEAAVGALAASWVGGSANMLAVKEALAVPDGLLAPLIVVDAAFAYAWMAFLISLAPRQDAFDRWVSARAVGGTGDAPLRAPGPWPVPVAAALALGVLAPAFGGAWGPALTGLLNRLSPVLGAGLSAATWSILFVTTGAILFSATGRLSTRSDRPERWGTFLLYFLLTTLGARARMGAVVRTPAFLAFGAILLAVHGAVLFIGGRRARLPLFLLASSSQACLGGTASAPVVAAVYRPALSAVGLLLAVLGNVTGTYVGLLVARLCGMFR